jgi:hypothetical protein
MYELIALEIGIKFKHLKLESNSRTGNSKTRSVSARDRFRTCSRIPMPYILPQMTRV